MYVYFPFSCIYYANYLTIIPYLITVLLYYLNSLSFITIHTLLIIGYIIIQKLIEQSIINGYEDILSNGNELSEKMQDIMKNILIYIENNVKT